jgi:hypothetical protein
MDDFGGSASLGRGGPAKRGPSSRGGRERGPPCRSRRGPPARATSAAGRLLRCLSPSRLVCEERLKEKGGCDLSSGECCCRRRRRRRPAARLKLVLVLLPYLAAPEPSHPATMLDSTKRRLRQHSRTVAVTVGVAGGLYLAGQYAVERLRDMQDKAADERRARERSVILPRPRPPSSLCEMSES